MNTPSVPRIAIIEDNDDFREEILVYLQHRGFPAWGVASAEAFWKRLHFHPVDIVLVDLGLPQEDGFSVVEHLRKLSGYGLVIITARGGKQERLRCLDLGADLFLVKPINFVQLSDTLTQLGQRLLTNANGGHMSTNNSRKTGSWYLEPAKSQLVTPDETSIRLTPKEFDLLNILIESSNQIFDRWLLHDLLFEHAEDPDIHRIDVVLSRLRQKSRQQGISLPLRSIFGKGITFIIE
ncbi:response regulator transcription factor [Vreelandella maris]|uniref:Response regulator transcription factor n=1 Tax=Vreelandella maris TaxID=2729617 RepID=A0A7Y6RAQ8_9GAMM|nr:response regulator transcription factor [Halomonas maris]NVF13458.1 response regulator transcription factor [Halomonas maris]|tara:strand:- start:19102 stop:19812 length:711 start_codon:yes stop_codon:yes gene_type:complete